MTDELLGFWENDVNDGSGFHEMVWGYAIEFLEGGNGVIHTWGVSVKEEEKEQKIIWGRVTENKITLQSIYVEEESDNDWDEIEYQITAYSSYFELVEKGKEGFWGFGNPLYKRKK